MNKSSKILSRIKTIVAEKFPDAKIYLYGSRARNNASLNSDWDLLILINEDKIDPDLEREITYPIYDLEFETGEVISPMVYSEKEWNEKYSFTSYHSNISKEGILL